MTSNEKKKNNSPLITRLCQVKLAPREYRVAIHLLSGEEESQAEIAEVSGLNKSMVSKAVKSLRDKNIVSDDSLALNPEVMQWRSAAKGAGTPPPPLTAEQREAEAQKNKSALWAARYFNRKIQSWNRDYPTHSDEVLSKKGGWAETFRLMFEKDKICTKAWRRVVDKMMADPGNARFSWRENVMSARKFREKYLRHLVGRYGQKASSYVHAVDGIAEAEAEAARYEALIGKHEREQAAKARKD